MSDRPTPAYEQGRLETTGAGRSADDYTIPADYLPPRNPEPTPNDPEPF